MRLKQLFGTKLIMTAVALFVAFFVANDVAKAAYPDLPSFSYGCMAIRDFELGTVPSGTDLFDQNVNDCGRIGETSTAIELEANTTYYFRIYGLCYGGTSCYYGPRFRIWIDWNANESFNDPGELVWSLNNSSSGWYSGQFTVPESAQGNTFRLRMAGRWYFYGWPNATGSQSGYGDAGDLLFFVPDPAADAGATEISQPAGAFTQGTQNIAVTIKNYLENPLESCRIVWRIDEGEPTEESNTYNWTGSLAQDEEEEVVVGTYNFDEMRTYTIDAFTEWPNEKPDIDNSNDRALQRVVAPALEPQVYVIGEDFANITEGTEYLSQAGVLGDGELTFQFPALEPGVDPPYQGPIVLGSYPSEGDNFVSIKSETGNPSDVTIEYAPSSTYTYLMSANNADNMTVEGITFEVDGSNGYGGILDFQGGQNLTIQNNVFNGVDGAPQDNDHITINMADAYDVTIQDNKFNDNAKGINETSSCPRKLSITNNDFEDQTWYFVQLYGNPTGSPCAENDVTVTDNDFVSHGGALYGLHSTNGTTIQDNRFSGFTGNGGSSSIIYLENTDPANFTDMTIVDNNQMTGGNQEINGIYADNLPKLQLTDNSVKISQTLMGPRADGLYISSCGSSTFPVDIKNNAVAFQNAATSNAAYIDNSNVEVNYCDFDVTSAGGTQYSIVANQTDGYIANSQIGGTDTYCVYLNNSDLGFYYNSVANQSVGLPTLRINGGSNTIMRNIFQNYSTGPVVSASGAGMNNIDQNNYHTDGSVFGSWDGSDAADFSEWQTVSGQDANSTNVEVQFADFNTFNLSLDLFSEELVYDDPLTLPNPEWNEEIQENDYKGQTRYSYFVGSENIVPEITINVQPTGVMDCKGAEDHALSVNASVTKGVQPRFEWYKDGESMTNLYEDPTTEEWADKASLYLDRTPYYDEDNPGLNYDMEGVYRCKVMGSGAEPKWTDYVLVNALSPAEVTRQPEDKRVNLGDDVMFEVEAHIVADEGDDALYQPDVQWFIGSMNDPVQNDYSVDGHYTGAQSTILSIRNIEQAQLADNYFVRLIGACDTLYSDLVGIRLYPEVYITGQPSSVEACEGEAASFDVTAEPSDDEATIEYQWRKDGVAIPNATESIYTVDPVAMEDAGDYDCVVSVLPGGNSETTESATLEVKEGVEIVKQPADQNAIVGQPFSMFVTAAGDPPLSYQWHKDGEEIDGETSRTFTVSSATFSHAGSYTVEVTNECGSVMSEEAVVSVSESDATGVGDAIAGGFVLQENTPNPFETETKINYYAPNPATVRIAITDSYGKEAAVITENAHSGWNMVELNASKYELSSGVYYYTLTSGEYTITRKMVIVK